MQFTLALSTLLVASAAAFAPASQTATRQSTQLADDLFGAGSGGDNKEMSKSLPFALRPKILDGTLAGDVGFE